MQEKWNLLTQDILWAYFYIGLGLSAKENAGLS